MSVGWEMELPPTWSLRLEGTKSTSWEKERGESPKAGNAYLGPKLWEKTISTQSIQEEEENKTISTQILQEEDFFVMNFEEFLAENNLQIGDCESETSPVPEEQSAVSPGSVSDVSVSSESVSGVSSRPVSAVSPGTVSAVSPPRSEWPPAPAVLSRPSIIVANRGAGKLPTPSGRHEFLYQESKRARREREKEEVRRRQLETKVDMEDLMLATVPGRDFDPSKRAFDMEELRPQAIIKKRPKIFVAPAEKDANYWDARTKNTIAARRSREARRLKENQIALRAAFLEKKNVSLRRDLDDANSALNRQRIEVDILKQKLDKYEQ